MTTYVFLVMSAVWHFGVIFYIIFYYLHYLCIKTHTATEEEPPPSKRHQLLPDSPAVLAVKQKIDELEEEFMTVVGNLFELLTQEANEAPDFINTMQSFMLTLQVKLGMKEQNTPFFKEHIDEIEFYHCC